MDLIKNVGGKLEEKIKSGDIKESELLEEATEFVNKMKDMPGMDNIQNLFSQMGMGNMGGKGKVNLNAMQAHLQNQMSGAKRKDRMRAKLAEKQKLAEMQKTPNNQDKLKLEKVENGVENLVYSTGETYEKSMKPTTTTKNKKNKKKKK